MNIICEECRRECRREACGCQVKDGKLDCPFCGATILKGPEDNHDWNRCYGF